MGNTTGAEVFEADKKQPSNKIADLGGFFQIVSQPEFLDFLPLPDLMVLQLTCSALRKHFFPQENLWQTKCVSFLASLSPPEPPRKKQKARLRLFPSRSGAPAEPEEKFKPPPTPEEIKTEFSTLFPTWYLVGSHLSWTFSISEFFSTFSVKYWNSSVRHSESIRFFGICHLLYNEETYYDNRGDTEENCEYINYMFLKKSDVNFKKEISSVVIQPKPNEKKDGNGRSKMLSPMDLWKNNNKWKKQFLEITKTAKNVFEFTTSSGNPFFIFEAIEKDEEEDENEEKEEKTKRFLYFPSKCNRLLNLGMVVNDNPFMLLTPMNDLLDD